MRVLVVEDDTMLADYLVDALEELDHCVCEIATTVAEAVTGIRSGRPEVAIIDVQLSHGELGTDIADQLASSNELGSLGILYVSGNADLAQQKARFGHGCLSKPYGLAALASALQIVHALAIGGGAPAALPHGLRLLGPASP